MRTFAPRSFRTSSGPSLRAAILLVDAVVGRAVDDDTYALARAHFSEDLLIEITQLAGLYVGVAMLVALIRPQPDNYRLHPVAAA